MFSPRSLSIAVVAAFLFAAPVQAQEVSQCFPIEAGGKGVNYKVSTHNDGLIYTWHCFSSTGVPRGVWIAANVESKPTNPVDPTALKNELTRLSVMQGHSRDGRIGYEARAQSQLKETAPAAYVPTPAPAANK